jgi:hypothetical protein
LRSPQTICALTYESQAGDDFLACAMNNDCVTFPEIPGECPMPEVSPDLSLATLAGEWWYVQKAEVYLRRV